MSRPVDDPRRAKLAKKYRLPASKLRASRMPSRFIDQLAACKSEAARRILLGKSK